MTTKEFVAELAEALEFEETIKPSTRLKDLEEWDSMGAMILVAFVSDNFDKNLTTDEIKSMTTVDSLIDLIGREKLSLE